MTDRTLRPGEPCRHPGCMSHITHPCEGCGRYGARTFTPPATPRVPAPAPAAAGASETPSLSARASAEVYIDALESENARLRKALYTVMTDFDHEEQTHDHQPFKYGGTCRVCLAERALHAPEDRPQPQPGARNG